MISTVVFDLDDTLYDEIDYCRSGFSAVSEYLSKLHGAFSTEQIFNSIWMQFTASDRTKVFNQALDDLKIPYDPVLIHDLVRIYREHLPNITLPADSKEVLEILCGKYALALLTDGFLPAQRLKVEALKLEKFFKCIIYTEELGRQYWKPSQAGFEKIQKILKQKPENTV
ncbi:MAG: HAD family hydrolase, partial [Candidatus Brocadiia bacterium]